MSRFRRARVPGGCYFFTVAAERRQPILANDDVRLALREAITQVRQVLPFRIDGWVLLPDHLHAIWTLPEGDADFSSRWRLIKRHVTRTCGPAYFRPGFLTPRRSAKQCGTLWQHRFWEHLIRDERDPSANGLPARQSAEAWAGNPRRRLALVILPSLRKARNLSRRLGR